MAFVWDLINFSCFRDDLTKKIVDIVRALVATTRATLANAVQMSVSTPNTELNVLEVIQPFQRNS